MGSSSVKLAAESFAQSSAQLALQLASENFAAALFDFSRHIRRSGP
jgi:hypothetical protein